MSNILDTIEGLPFYDYFVDKWNDYAGEKFQTKDPFVEELPNGKTRKLKLPNYCSKEDAKVWKKVQKMAWKDDKCFCGCYPVDCGIGLGPILVLLPAIGPLLMYAIHARLIHYADQHFHLGAKTVAKLELNILFDLLITLPPVIGSFLSFLNGCSTRNAAMIYNAVAKKSYETHQQNSGGNMDASILEEEELVYLEQRPPTLSKLDRFLNKFDNVKLNEDLDSRQGQQPQQQQSGYYQ